MPLELTDAELATAATACRAMAYQEDERATKNGEPRHARTDCARAQRFAALAAKFDTARKSEQAWERKCLTPRQLSGGILWPWNKKPPEIDPAIPFVTFKGWLKNHLPKDRDEVGALLFDQTFGVSSGDGKKPELDPIQQAALGKGLACTPHRPDTGGLSIAPVSKPWLRVSALCGCGLPTNGRVNRYLSEGKYQRIQGRSKPNSRPRYQN